MSSTIEQTTIRSGTWAIDPTHSTIGFTVVYMGVAPFKGAFRSFEATLDDQGLRGVVQASSVDVDNDQLAEHLASPEFFDTANHPELSFEAGPGRREGDRVTFEGVLEVKGNRAPITLSGTITDPVSDPWGNSSMLADEVELAATLVFVAAATGNEA